MAQLLFLKTHFKPINFQLQSLWLYRLRLQYLALLFIFSLLAISLLRLKLTNTACVRLKYLKCIYYSAYILLNIDLLYSNFILKSPQMNIESYIPLILNICLFILLLFKAVKFALMIPKTIIIYISAMLALVAILIMYVGIFIMDAYSNSDIVLLVNIGLQLCILFFINIVFLLFNKLKAEYDKVMEKLTKGLNNPCIFDNNYKTMLGQLKENLSKAILITFPNGNKEIKPLQKYTNDLFNTFMSTLEEQNQIISKYNESKELNSFPFCLLNNKNRNLSEVADNLEKIDSNFSNLLVQSKKEIRSLKLKVHSILILSFEDKIKQFQTNQLSFEDGQLLEDLVNINEQAKEHDDNYSKSNTSISNIKEGDSLSKESSDDEISDEEFLSLDNVEDLNKNFQKNDTTAIEQLIEENNSQVSLKTKLKSDSSGFMNPIIKSNYSPKSVKDTFENIRGYFSFFRRNKNKNLSNISLHEEQQNRSSDNPINENPRIRRNSSYTHTPTFPGSPDRPQFKKDENNNNLPYFRTQIHEKFKEIRVSMKNFNLYNLEEKPTFKDELQDTNTLFEKSFELENLFSNSTLMLRKF